MQPPPSEIDEILAHQGYLRALAVRLVGLDQADDLAQETLLRALVEKPGATGVGLKAWLGTVAKRLAIRGGERGRNRQRAEDLASRGEAQGPADRAEYLLDLQSSLTGALRKLPDPYRAAVVMRYLEEKSFGEMAVALGLSEAACRKRISRGVVLLREDLDGIHGDRASWVALLLPLATGDWSTWTGAGLASLPTTTSTTFSTGPAAPTGAYGLSSSLSLVGVLMMKKTLIAICVLAISIGWFVNARAGKAVEPPQAPALNGDAPEKVAQGEPDDLQTPGQTETRVEGSPVQDTTPSTKSKEEISESKTFEQIYEDLLSLRATARKLGPKGPPGFEFQPFAPLAKGLYSKLVAAEGASEKLLALVSRLDWRPKKERDKAQALIVKTAMGLTLRHHWKQKEDQVDMLCAELIAAMPQSHGTAQTVESLLVNAPYLGAIHEPKLLDLAKSAQEERAFLAEPIGKLLVTLWSNLDLSPDEMRDRLLSIAGEQSALGDGARQRLLLDPRYRALILEQIIASGDETAIAEAADLLARELEPEEAVTWVQKLKGETQYASFMGAYLTLGRRAEDALGASYHAALLADAEESHRVEALVVLANFTEGDPLGWALQGYEQDTSAKVRGVALMALGRQAAPQEFHRILDAARMDEAFANSRSEAYLVSALSNYAGREDADETFVARSARTLLELPNLRTIQREKLEGLLE